ncbi:MAG: hypothetical protein H0X59_08825 [Chloroflexi bacterium]|nr:hypothetical protein [Chloroflexota bacterium]
MRSRLAITSMLAFGVLMTSSGAALGVSALTTTPSASQAQYGQVLSESAEGEEPGASTLGGGGNGEVAGDSAGGSDVAGDSAGDAPLAAQAARQLESGEGAELPFTGYAAVPTLLIGIGLLAMGLILRRKPGHPAAQA